MVSVLVPSGVSFPGNKGVHKLIGLSVWFGLSQGFSSGGKNTSAILGYSAHCNAISQACGQLF
ncbi:hypothetical protein T06_10870, partial [Trichinella sp. T6]